MIPFRALALAASLLAALPARAESVVSGLTSTGVGPDGSLLPAGAADPSWFVSGPGVSLRPATVVGSDAYPVSPNGPWAAGDAVSEWLMPDAYSTRTLDGLYTYATSFTIAPGVDPRSILVSGRWATDNLGYDILVNGHDTGISNHDLEGFDFTPFSIPSADLVTGVNRIAFVVLNGLDGLDSSGYSDYRDPSGLRVEFDPVAAGDVQVPEPSLPVLAAFAALGLVAVRHRRRRV